MLLGAHLAGCAIENSMLGAAHATANPLTAEFNIPHGLAVGVMLPYVIRFNVSDGNNYYQDVHPRPTTLAARVNFFLKHAQAPMNLRGHNIPKDALPRLAAHAAKQWTATFNPRPVSADDFVELYRAAFEGRSK